MTIKVWLKAAAHKLNTANIPTARLDCLVLLEDVTDKDRSWLLAHPEFELNEDQLTQLRKQIERRSKHEPLAYIRGKSAFYGRDFFVTADTLQPRPETETMIETLLQTTAKLNQVKNIIDVGTGSGCIAVTAKLELPNLEVHATDISAPCLNIAKKNARNLKADVEFIQTNLVSGIDGKLINNSILCCNLPYVPSNFTINQAAMFEPEIAIFGGKDGLEYFRQLFEQLDNKQVRPLLILSESLPTQHQSLEDIANKYNYKLINSKDFIQCFSC